MASAFVIKVVVEGKESIDELVETLKELKRLDRRLYRIVKKMIRKGEKHEC